MAYFSVCGSHYIYVNGSPCLFDIMRFSDENDIWGGGIARRVKYCMLALCLGHNTLIHLVISTHFFYKYHTVRIWLRLLTDF